MYPTCAFEAKEGDHNKSSMHYTTCAGLAVADLCKQYVIGLAVRSKWSIMQELISANAISQQRQVQDIVPV